MLHKDILKKSDSELVETVQKDRDAVRTFRFSTAGSATRDVRAVRTAKKDIARCLTELNRRASAEKSAPKTT